MGWARLHELTCQDKTPGHLTSAKQNTLPTVR